MPKKAEREFYRSAARHAGASKRCCENKARQAPLNAAIDYCPGIGIISGKLPM